MEEIDLDLGNGYRLRSLRAGEAEAMYAATVPEEERLRPWMPWAHDNSLENSRRYQERALAEHAAGEVVPVVIECDGTIAGAASINRIDAANRSAPIGYWLAGAHVGRGVMTATVRALIDHAFGPLGLHRVEIRAAPDNRRSRAIPERLGFTQDGVLREAERFPDHYGDLVVYSLLAHEWSA